MERMRVEPVTLEGELVRLEPLREEHAAELSAIADDPDIWRWMTRDLSASPEAMAEWVNAALGDQTAGNELPFIIRDRADGSALGSTRYMDIRPGHRSLEIGWTWLGKRARRTGVNTECKYLLLCHAFEDLGAIRVQLKTDRRNIISQRAIERIGASREGILRKHVILSNGYIRDTVMFSVTDDEWPVARANLERMRRREHAD